MPAKNGKAPAIAAIREIGGQLRSIRDIRGLFFEISDTFHVTRKERPGFPERLTEHAASGSAERLLKRMFTRPV
jgi:hypothetical protein